MFYQNDDYGEDYLKGLKDASDPQWDNDPGMKQFVEFLTDPAYDLRDLNRPLPTLPVGGFLLPQGE